MILASECYSAWVIMRGCLRDDVLIELRVVTDGQTDRETDRLFLLLFDYVSTV